MINAPHQRLLTAARERPFEIGASLFLSTIALSHIQWLFKIGPIFTGLREVVFLLSLISLVWASSELVGERRIPRLVFSAVILLGLVTSSLVVNRYLFDLSPDTLTSHFELTHSTALGVNPYFESWVEGSLDEYSVFGVSFHMLAGIGFNLGFTRNPFIFPYLHMVLLATSALISWGRNYVSRQHVWIAACITIFAFPTLAQQLLTGYRDGYSGLAVLTCAVLIIHGWVHRFRDTSTLLIALVFSACLPSIKLPLVPTALLLGATCVVGLISSNGINYVFRIRTLVVAVLVALLWAFPVIFALFTSNETSRSLLSAEAITTTWSGSSERLLQMNVIQEFGTLMFGISQANPPDITWSLPFQFPSATELIVSGRPDPRLAGFGPWFGEAFVFALLAAVTATVALRRISGVDSKNAYGRAQNQRRTRDLGIYWWLALVMIVGFLLTPFRFNSRYVVQLYVLLLLLIAISLMSRHSKNRYALVARVLCVASLAFLIANSLFAWYGAANVAIEDRRLTLELIDNYVDRVDEAPSTVKYSIVTGGKWGFRRYLPSQTPEGRAVMVELSCNPDTSTRVYWLGDDIGICQHNLAD